MMRMGCVMTIVFVVVVAVLADLGVTQLVERVATERVSEQLGAPASVDLAGWPVTVQLISGTADATVTARNVALRRRDVIVRRVEATLSDISASISGVRVGGGRLVATVDEQELARTLSIPDELPVTRLRVRPDGVVLELDQLPPVSATVAARRDRLVLQPTSGAFGGATIVADLQDLPLGVRLTEVRLGDGRVDVVGVLTRRARARLEFPLLPR